MRVRTCLVIVGVLLSAGAAPATSASSSTRYGDIEFPKDEHQHVNGFDYWWGAADLLTKTGNRYTVGIAFDSFDGYGDTGHQVFPRQGPYKGLSIMTVDGPSEWGHPGEVPGQYARKMSVYAPGVSDRLTYETLDTANGMKDIGHWERTRLDRQSYRLRLDDDRAKVHPTGKTVRLVVDLHATMQQPPLLAGGTGKWWYGIPQTYKYPSRSFQYMQVARTLTGTLELEQPDGTTLQETVVPRGSRMLIVHEYDATPEDLGAGLGLAEATQLHQRYVQYYEGGMPWELIFLDLDNGAQLMLAVMAFHDTPKGTVTPVVSPDQPTYQVLATLRLPSGESVPLDKDIGVEHLSYRTIVGRVPTFMVQVTGVWLQAWDYRVSYGGGRVRVPGGGTVHVPAFDLGVVPQFAQSEPAADNKGNRLTQRVPFVAAGSYAGCPVHGFGWSELIINWYGHENDDPWFTGGDLPPVPAGCGRGHSQAYPKARTRRAQRGEQPPPKFASEGCTAYNPGSTPRCEYDATVAGGVGGYGGEPGGWTVTITRRGRRPRVVTSFGGSETYACGTVLAGDHVVAEAKPGSGVVAGNPGICY